MRGKHPLTVNVNRAVSKHDSQGDFLKLYFSYNTANMIFVKKNLGVAACKTYHVSEKYGYLSLMGEVQSKASSSRLNKFR
jgi:hypothetical protein